MGIHKKHRKEAVAARVNKDRRMHHWLIKLNKIYFEIELKRKEKE